MPRLRPKKNETPLAFVERADCFLHSEDAITHVLKTHFDFKSDAQIKALKLQSRFFWKRFYLQHVRELHARGGSKFAAIKFIQRKNGKAGQKPLTETEIHDLVNSVGRWKP